MIISKASIMTLKLFFAMQKEVAFAQSFKSRKWQGELLGKLGEQLVFKLAFYESYLPT